MPPADLKPNLYAQLDRLMGFFPRIDSKATFLLAIDFAMLGVLAKAFPLFHLASPRGVFAIVAGVLLSLSLGKLCVAFLPHFDSGEHTSIVYFKDIASLGWRGYHHAVATISDDELIDDLTCQIWRNSEILKIKFAAAEAALIFMLIALPFWLMMLAAVTLRSGKVPF